MCKNCESVMDTQFFCVLVKMGQDFADGRRKRIVDIYGI